MSRPIDYAVIQRICKFDDLISVLRDNLDWDIEELSLDDLTYEFSKQELKLKDDDAAIKNVRLFRAPSDLSWGIVFVDFGQDRLQRGSLRQILNAFAQKARKITRIPAYPLDKIVFFCQHDDTAWTIANYKGDKPGTAKLETFGWHDPEEARTAIENLSKLKWKGNWQDAWDVKRLTDEFFKELSDLFFGAIEHLKPAIPDENDRRLYVQIIFNRLIFLRFVEKKGWLKLNGRQDYLKALWNACKEPDAPSWNERLKELFLAINDPNAKHRNAGSKALIGDVVYLNGGLFDRDARLEDPNLALPIETYQRLVSDSGLLYRYNFTIEESSPLDVQVAVDPEILGKIFEQLTIATKRHDTGSYYTPRGIVQFMCREALVGYLSSGPLAPPGERVGEPANRGEGLSEAKARALVYDHDDSTLTNQEGNWAFQKLKDIKVVDPACGSGAYLLGMLQELYALFEKLRRDDRKFSDDPAKEAHERKLWIIENNLYGVDIQQFAANTAMLRLWLTLLVEDTGETPQPLPNLEYKIETGDSLLGPDPSQPIDWSKVQRGLDFEAVEETVESLRKLRSKYQDSHGPAKTEVKKEFEAKLAEMREKVTGSPNKDPAKFDWRVEFFDVFLEDPKTRTPGFDVALANPPYVRKEEIRAAIKPRLAELYGDAITGRSDLYCSFFVRAVQLLAKGGMHIFVCSSAWLDSTYGAKLQAWMLGNCHLKLVLDSAVEKQFSTANVNTSITVLRACRAAPSDLSRFMLLRAPFEEAIVHPERRQERVLTQSELRMAGEHQGTYVGGKWGGKLLRAPQVYFDIFADASNVSMLREIASVEGYIHDSNTGAGYRLAHVIWSLGDVQLLHVRPGGPGIRCVGVSDAGNSRQFSPILFPRTFGSRHAVPFCSGEVLGKEFYKILPRDSRVAVWLAAQLNSTLGILQREVLGIRGFGGGALKFASEDVSLFLILTQVSVDALGAAFLAMADRPVLDIDEELEQPDRQAMDAIIFDALHLSASDRLAIYSGVRLLVSERTQRASSTRERRSRPA